MAVKIELHPDQEKWLVTEAHKRSLSIEEYLSRAIAGEFPLPPPPWLEVAKQEEITSLSQNKEE